MQSAEIRDTGRLVGGALGELAELVRDVHTAVAGRVFGVLGPVAAPARVLHDAIAATAYASAWVGVRTLPVVAGAATAGLRTGSADSSHDTPRGHVVLGALNGIWGDRLAERHAALAPTVSVRTHTGRLRRRPRNLVSDLDGTATGRIVLFVHGLCETDRLWWLGAARNHGDPGVTYGSLLRDERGWTPLYLDYNSGLHISENGRRVAEHLEQLIAVWPVPVTEIALVGHSMGGLVVRSAAHQAAAADQVWVRALAHVVGLGTPHLGAPLERWVNSGTHVLGRLPETRPFATWLNRRSVGIKDLRHGAIVEDDWHGSDPEDRADHCTPATMVPGVAYSMVSATLSRRPSGPFAHDLLVAHSSAHGTGTARSRRIEFDVDRLYHVGGRHHFTLLGDPDVYRQLRSWLDGADGAERGDANADLSTDERTGDRTGQWAAGSSL